VLTLRSCLVAAVATIGGCSPETAQTEREDPWSAAEAGVVRLVPADFAGTPPRVRESLEELGCRIPQAWGEPEPHNLISGRFAASGQVDWAALCSRDGISELVIIWGGAANCQSGLASTADRTYLQALGAEGILFSRAIDSVSAESLRRYWTYAEEVRRPRSFTRPCPMRFSKRARRPTTATKVDG
jgi:hypothetical protein